MPANSNRAWNLESFLDSLIVELDKAQDTLSYKGITRKLTYTVKDVGLDLQIFPQFDGRTVRFVTAQPGDAGSSKISIQLGSISDRQIRETTKEPPSRDDITIEDIEGLDSEVKDSLRKVGITSADDLERVEKKNVSVEGAVKRKIEPGDAESGSAGAPRGVDYANLAKLINQAKRKRQFAPRVASVGLAEGPEGPVLMLSGENLVIGKDNPRGGTSSLSRGMAADSEFPVAVLDGERIPVLSAGERLLRLALPKQKLRSGPVTLSVALDPYAVITVEIKP